MRGIRSCAALRALGVAGVLVAALAMAPSALAVATPSTDINSTGPLTDIWIGTDTGCQVAYSGDTADEFYGPQSAPADCGTFISTGGTQYGPDFANHGYSATPGSIDTPFTPVSQSAVTGSGTTASPYSLTTTETVGSTGLTLTETDSYVVGSESYETDITVANSGTSAVTALLYHGGDCYLQGNDHGYGFVDSATNGPACTENANNSPTGRIEELQPITPGAHYLETGFGANWAAIAAQTDLPNTCDCTTYEDNGASINWDLNVPAGGQVTYSLLTSFSPSGALGLSTAKTADSSSATVGGSDGYTITISNPNASAVSLATITDTLPTGFTYTAGSSTGATTSDPTVTGQDLSWAGPMNVPAASGGTPGTVTLHFKVTVSSTTGTYYNDAGGTATGYTVAPTGPTAAVTVNGAGDAGDTSQGQAVSATEGQAVSGATVATFTDTDNDSSASDYTASINWGDGTAASAGTVSGTGGSYTVTGSHTYAEHGSYQVTVTITDTDAPTNITTPTSTATVSERPLSPTGAGVSATEGQSFNGTVATFTDGDTAPAASEYSATIDWGDGTSTSAGTITGSAGSFTVTGSHTYAEEGSHTVHVTVQETDNSATAATSMSTATVADAALSGAGKGTLASAASFSGAVATFTDANSSAPVSDFTASINWGDATAASTGTVTGSAGSYTVTGGHTYAAAGSYTVHVSIADDGGSTASPSTTIVVTIPTTGNSAPVCTGVTANPNRLWPPNHKFQLVTLSGATDPDGDTLTYDITGVQQDEPVLGPDKTEPDAKPGPTANTVKLRAERKGKGHGRLYFIAVTVSDGHGNSCNATVVVAVPHDHHQRTVPDTGKRYDSYATPPRPSRNTHGHHHGRH